MSAPICVTGMGICSPIGNTVADVTKSLREGVSGIREHSGIFQGRNIWVGLAQLETSSEDYKCVVDRAGLLALQAARSAWTDSCRHAPVKCDGGRVALLLGTSHGGRSQIDYCLENPETFQTEEASDRILEISPHFRQTEFVAGQLGIHGPVVTVSTACSSSSAAILYGIDLLKSGRADCVLAGGMDGFSKLTHSGFRALGAVSDGPCGPFSDRIGISLGEGAAVIVLERLEDALERRANIWAELYGAGSSWDCYHITEPEPSGAGLLRALEMAAKRGDVAAGQKISYASLHGTGTRANDAAETLAVKRFFKDSSVPPVSSVKSFTGHTLGASGAVGIISAILGMQEGFLPPTVNFGSVRPGCDLDYVPNRSRPGHIHQFSSQSAGFGGVNVVVMGGRQRNMIGHRAVPKAQIAISGMGVVSAAGIGVTAFRESLITGRSGIAPVDRFDVSGMRVREAGLVRAFEPRKIAPMLNLRRVDLCFQYAAVAVMEALDSSRIVSRGIDPAEIGLVVGTTRGAVSSFERSMASAMGGMWDNVGPIHFPNLVMSSLGGYISKTFNLQGAASTVVCGCGGGLQAVIHAADLLRHNSTQRAMVVVLADELSPMFFKMFSESTFHSRNGAAIGEGAAAFVLEKWPTPTMSENSIVISGYEMTADAELSALLQISGQRFSDAISGAIRDSRIAPEDVGLVYGQGAVSHCHDEREFRALGRVCRSSVPFSSVLMATGLAESASAGFSVAAALLSLKHLEAYPIAEPSPSYDWNFVRSQPMAIKMNNVLVTSSSTAGNNGALVLSTTQN